MALRFQRRAGEWIARQPKAKGATEPGTERGKRRGNNVLPRDQSKAEAPTLAELGIEKINASQALAADPEVKPLGPPAPAKGGASPNAAGRRGNKVASVNLDSNKVAAGNPKGGNRAAYLVRRLKRDAPEVRTTPSLTRPAKARQEPSSGHGTAGRFQSGRK